MKEIKLFTPGPTPVPESVREAEAAPMIHHRSEEFSAILSSVRMGLIDLCATAGDAVVMSSSGTGGMEAAVTSLFGRGDEVVVVEGGKFGQRWEELATHFGLKANILRVEWGRAVDPAVVKKQITKNTKGILIQACESSTGAYHPVEKIGDDLKDRDDVLLVVDGITAMGVHDIDMERDRIDVLIGGSQKALMCPPGLSIVALSHRALSKLNEIQPQSYYLSLQRETRLQPKGNTGFTPAISIIRALAKALELIASEGKANVFARHHALQQLARRELKSMGLTLFNRDDEATWGITSVEAPKGRDLKAWMSDLKKSEGLWMTGGQGELTGKIFRLSHMGACHEKDLSWALDTIRRSLS